MRVNFSKMDKIFLAYISIFFVLSAFFSSFSSLMPDEGTHLLLSIFYKDMITHIVSTGDFSFNGAYSYAINYLVRYPKLQIAYPPLYHLTNALFFSIFGPSALVGKLVNLAYAVLAFTVFYFFVKKYFGDKPAFMAALLFSLSPFSLFFSSKAWLDYTFIFWFITALYLFSRAMETKRSRDFAICGFATGLALLGRQMGGFLLAFYLVVIILSKEDVRIRIKSILIIAATFAIIATPYIIILNAAGGMDINVMVAQFYAVARGQPTSYLEPMFWLYYLVYTPTAAPFFPIFLLGLVYYSWKRQKMFKELLMFFLVMYIFISLVPTKESRFSEVFMLPAYVAVSVLLCSIKRKAIPVVFVASYFVVSVSLILPTILYYPAEDIVNKMVPNMPARSSIAMLSDDAPLFSSVLMWYVRVADKSMEHSVYRPCAFSNMSAEEIRTIFRENGVYYVVYSDWSTHHEIDLIKDELEPAFSVEKDGKKTDVYLYKDFVPQTKNCNYVCLTQKQVCS